MSDGASTSKESSFSEIEKSKLLQQALSQAGAKRAQLQRKRKSVELQNPNIEEHKTKIKAHPLMPIIKTMIEKIEHASRYMKSSNFKIDDVVQQLGQMERDGVSIRTNDSEVDELMMTAMISLRTQLAELQKVTSLTDSFFHSYTSKLKKRVNQETLVGAQGDSDDDMGTATPEEELRRLHPSSFATLTTVNGMVTLPIRLPPHPLNFLHTSGNNGTSRSIFPLDATSPMTVPFTHLPFFTFPQIQALQRHVASSSEETQD